MTGYFSADALALAARGIQNRIANEGHMRLVVGCTLNDDEIEAIERGYLREKVHARPIETPLSPSDDETGGRAPRKKSSGR